MSGAAEPIVKKIVRKHGGGGHGGSWKVAYADFMTAMMAFFLVMWLVVTLLSSEQRLGLAVYFRPSPIFQSSGLSLIQDRMGVHRGDSDKALKRVSKSSKQKEAASAPIMTAKQLQQTLTDLVDNDLTDVKDQVAIELQGDGVRIEIMDNDQKPLFQMSSADLNPNARRILRSLSRIVALVENKLVIEGHTDAFNFSSRDYTNWDLSTERALSARREMELDGLDNGRLLMIAGRGSSQPLFKDNPKDPRNRRITLLLLYPESQTVIAQE